MRKQHLNDTNPLKTKMAAIFCRKTMKLTVKSAKNVFFTNIDKLSSCILQLVCIKNSYWINK